MVQTYGMGERNGKIEIAYVECQGGDCSPGRGKKSGKFFDYQKGKERGGGV